MIDNPDYKGEWKAPMVDNRVEIKSRVHPIILHQSFLGDDAAVLARSSSEEPASPRRRAGVVAMVWRS